MRENPTLNRQKNGAISLKGFGAVKNEFTRFTNMLQYTMDKNIIYIFHTVEEKDGDIVKQRLMCEGAARNIVWQPCDLGCQLMILGEKRFMGFGPDERYFAKRCYGISGLVEIPNLDNGAPNDMADPPVYAGKGEHRTGGGAVQGRRATVSGGHRGRPGDRGQCDGRRNGAGGRRENQGAAACADQRKRDPRDAVRTDP